MRSRASKSHCGAVVAAEIRVYGSNMLVGNNYNNNSWFITIITIVYDTYSYVMLYLDGVIKPKIY